MPTLKPVTLTVLQVIPALDAGGAERTAVDVARAVVKAGGKAWIATKGGRLAAEAEKGGAKIVTGDFDTKHPMAILRNAETLADLIRTERIAIIHARSRAPAWSAYFAAQRTGAKYVATYHGIYNAKNPIKRWYNSIMAKGDAVIANSQFTADHVVAQHKVDAKKLHVIPRGIDVKGFTPANVTQDRIDAIRKQWNLTPGKPVIVMPGRLTRWKGQLVFIEALARLPDRTFEAVMVGDAQERDAYVDELHASLKRLNLTDAVRIPGHCSDMPAALMAADVIVAPSIEPEAFGRVAVEAQAMGRPIVASRLGAQTETVADGITGFLFPPGDAEALAQGITRALALSPDQRKAMAKKARDRVLASYSVQAMCEATLKVYRDILKAPRENP
ncbi:MAG: glycosyltransferase family 4 protein [Alphaproteobacteria bacterium]|nr:glycosyltransferase family 4 protein [Alphaproteobacteria bacterium]